MPLLSGIFIVANLHVVLKLEEVMENETYKNAKLILERFDPDSKKTAVSIQICNR